MNGADHRVRLKNPTEIDGLMEEAAYLARSPNNRFPEMSIRIGIIGAGRGLYGRHPGRPVGGGGPPF